MYVINASDIGSAWVQACNLFREKGYLVNTRNGKALQMSGVFATEYSSPMNHVLYCPARDANPFFHLMEALWMLGGRNDVAFLEQYNSTIRQFSDDGVSFNGAYGYRWRHQFGKDQLEEIARNLEDNNVDRRNVLQMWSSDDLSCQTRDVPCNLSATFQLEKGRLNMVVFNRSNDLVWGAMGANVVHFSVLLMYLANKIGAEVGTYTQVSANTHVYERHFDLIENASADVPLAFEENRPITFGPEFDMSLQWFLAGHSLNECPFFKNVANPMRKAYSLFKNKQNPDRFDEALDCLATVPLSPWTVAAHRWILRRSTKSSGMAAK